MMLSLRWQSFPPCRKEEDGYYNDDGDGYDDDYGRSPGGAGHRRCRRLCRRRTWRVGTCIVVGRRRPCQEYHRRSVVV